MATTAVILLLVTFTNISAVKSHSSETGIPGSQFNAALSGCLLSAILVILLQIVSFFVLLRSTTWASQKRAGSSLSFSSSSFFHMALFLLLTGITLTSTTHYEDQMKLYGGWTSSDHSALTGTYWLCFITTGAYLIMSATCLLLLRDQRSMLGMPPDVETSMARLRMTGAPMSHEGSVNRMGPAVTVLDRSDTAPPSDYAESVAAARKNLSSGAWGR